MSNIDQSQIEHLAKMIYNKGFADALRLTYEARYAEPQRKLMQEGWDSSELKDLLPRLIEVASNVVNEEQK